MGDRAAPFVFRMARFLPDMAETQRTRHAEPDWAAAGDETVQHLREMLRIETVNPPGNEMPLARYVERVLKADGIECTMLEPAPGRGTVVARLRGDGSRQPVLLMAHMDTVSVEREHWSTDPFGGEVKDGYVYGRGAIDDKGMLAANLETMLLLKRHLVDAGRTLARDVIMLASADEESGGPYGIGWMIEHHPELIRAEFALNEGGRMRVVNGELLYAAVQSAEKVPNLITLTAHGEGGHASIPLEGNALFRLGRALARIADHREPVHLLPTTRDFFAGLSRVWPDAAERAAMADVASRDPRRIARGAKRLSRVPTLGAVLRTGISATVLAGGKATNVIPTEACATLNVRTLPGQSIDNVAASLRRVIADPRVVVEVTQRGEDAPASPVDSTLFRALAESAESLHPGLAVVPYLSTGATESAKLRRWGVPAYGILPFPLAPEDENRMHGNDERVPVEALVFGTRLVYGAVVRVAESA